MRFLGKLARLKAIITLTLLMAATVHIAAFDVDSETVAVYAEDCAAQKASFNLGDGVCALVAGAPVGPPVQRRFEWIAPDGTVFQLGPDIVSNAQSNSINIPASGPFAQVGVWAVKTIDASNNGFAVAQFMVQDADKIAADLSVNLFAPFQSSAGANITFTLLAKNGGPNEARNVEIKIGAPSNAALLSAEQTSGPRFSYTAAPHSAGPFAVCSIASLPVNSQASFAFVYQIEPGAANGLTLASMAQISSSTFELCPSDNLATVTSLVTEQPCSLACPANIAAPKQPGECGAVVNFDRPSRTGNNCGILTCNPASGSFFPVGATIVTCIGNTGVPCNFTVDVEDPQSPALGAVFASPPILLAPDRKMRDVIISYDASDNCEGKLACSLEVIDNERINSIARSADWEIVDAHRVRLRAEQLDKNRDRIYTIAVTCSDKYGNSSSKAVVVALPRNRQ